MYIFLFLFLLVFKQISQKCNKFHQFNFSCRFLFLAKQKTVGICMGKFTLLYNFVLDYYFISEDIPFNFCIYAIISLLKLQSYAILSNELKASFSKASRCILSLSKLIEHCHIICCCSLL